MTKLSIIIPTYNNADQISRCLDSIFRSTPSFTFEVIVINDGSTDSTLSILQQYKSIIIINQTNSGVSVARNAGISKAHGEYIMFVDADDFLDANWTEIIAPLLDKKLDLVAFSKNLTEKPDVKNLPLIICGFGQKINFSSVCLKLFNRNIIHKHHISFNANIINGEDMLFNLEFNCYCNNYYFSKKDFYNYSRNAGSATNTFNPYLIKSDLLFQKQLSKILQKYRNEHHYLNNLSAINAWVTIFDRYSHSSFFSKKDLSLLLDNPYYQKALQCYNKYRTYFSKQKLIIFWLLSHHLYKTTFYLMKLRHILKRFQDQNERM